MIFLLAKDDVVKILKAVGIEPATENVDRLLTTMKGKKLHEVYKFYYYYF